MAMIGSQSLLRIVPRTSYDASALTGGVIRFPVAQHIDVLGYSRAALQVRVYRGSVPSGATVTVQVADDGSDPTEPGMTLLQPKTAAGDEIGAVTLTERTAFPFYQSISIDVPATIGRLMAVLLSFEGGAEAGPVIEIGLDLVLSGGRVGATVSQPSTYLGYAHEPVERLETFEPLGTDEDINAVAPTVAGKEDFLARVADAVRSVLGLAGEQGLARLPGYPRFGNVNVAVARPVEKVESAELMDVVRALILRGGLDLETPDGGYARFGNVNVGIGARPPVGEPDTPGGEGVEPGSA